jgi:hypothetical protein
LGEAGIAWSLEPGGRVIGCVDVEACLCVSKAVAQTNIENPERSDQGISSKDVIVMETDREMLPLWREVPEEEVRERRDEEARQMEMERETQIIEEKAKIKDQNSSLFVHRRFGFDRVGSHVVGSPNLGRIDQLDLKI